MNSFRTTLAALVALAIAGGGCTAVDRAGGKAAAATTTLTFAQPNEGAPGDPLQAWATEVERRSEGSLEIEFSNGWRLGEATYEASTVADVAAGKADLAWVGARVFDTLGVTDFQALLAPALVDSQDLQSVVFQDGIPGEMLAGVSDAGVTGLGVLPGPMRKVLGVGRPFREPADFVGVVVGMQDSALTEAAMQALGATTQAMPSAAELDGLDAYEQQLGSISSNGYAVSADYVTGNLNLWPRPLVVIANTETFEGLTDDQQTALHDAADAVTGLALDVARDEDETAADQLCRQGMSLAEADDDQLAELAAAWVPVYDEVAQDLRSAEWLDRILSLKESLAAPPDNAECSDTPQGSARGVLPDGIYRATLTLAQLRTTCRPGDPGAELLDFIKHDQVLLLSIDGDQVYQSQYDAGHPELEEQGWIGTYRAFRDSFELLEGGGLEPLVSTYDFDGRRLLLTDMQTPACDHRAIWTDHAWERVEQTPQDETTDPVEGDYRAVIDWPTVSSGASCVTGPEGAGVTVYELALHDGLVELRVRIGGHDAPAVHGYVGSYRVFRDQIELDDGRPLTAQVEVDEERLTLSDMTGGGCGDVAIWTTSPWERIDDGETTTSDLAGVWTSRLTSADWKAAGLDGPAGTFTLTFDDTMVTVTEPDGDTGYRATYEAFRGRLVTSEAVDVLHAAYRVEGDLLHLTDVTLPGVDEGGPYVLVWESHPWVRQAG